ncbi:MAG: metallophosphatase [Bacteroidota bacterium]|nr:metallophosphatase [Bacteroidota bacterium]MDP3145045.1 metallophosphatase [Bacteroidota bacterium]
MADFNFQNRRDFLKYTLGSAAAVYGLNSHAQSELLLEKGLTKLTILYTNDQHSRIEPFPENDTKYPGEAGFAKRASLIEKIKSENKNVLLLDAGDIFQGTPYFNYYHGEIEYKLMSLMGYDAVTFGNHDFDLGCENIVKQMPHASFDFINCNYRFDDTPLSKNKKITPYKTYKKGHLKIGVLGIGIDLENLVDIKYTKGIIYNDPISCANKIADVLKNDEKCDYIICLSHLGFKYDTNKISDVTFAEKTKNINLIIGGHTHTFLDKPHSILNSENKEVQITQVGWAGIWLGQIEVFFSSYNKKSLQNNKNIKI